MPPKFLLIPILAISNSKCYSKLLIQMGGGQKPKLISGILEILAGSFSNVHLFWFIKSLFKQLAFKYKDVTAFLHLCRDMIFALHINRTALLNSPQI